MTRPARGFTLAEVLIALGITSLIGGLAWSSFSTTIRAREVVEGEAGIYRELRGGMNRMSRELSMAFISRNYDTTRYRDNTDRPTYFTGERDKVAFSMFGHQRLTKDAKESDQSIVFYKVDRDPDEKTGETALVRCEKPVIDEYPDRCDRWETLISGVRKLDLRYWDNKRKDWVDTWDTRRLEHPDQLPDRVRIELVARDDQGKDQKYVTQARINLVTVLESK